MTALAQADTTADAARVEAPQLLEIRLTPTRLHRRVLMIVHGRNGDGDLRASLYAAGRYSRMLAYAGSSISGARLEIRGDRSCIWLGRSSFDLSKAEALRIERELAPRGLPIERQQ